MTKKKGLLIAFVVLIGLSYACSSDTQKDSSKPTTSQTQQQAKAPSKEEVAYDKFLKINMGSSLADVKNALGVDGKLDHENDVAGIKTQDYTFTVGSAHMNMMFQDGALTAKSIASLSFLKPNGDDITMAQFEKVQTGMNYDQVKQILGREGRLLSQSSIMGETSTMYMWLNKGGANLNISFNSSGVVDSKTQFGLK